MRGLGRVVKRVRRPGTAVGGARPGYFPSIRLTCTRITLG